MEWRRIDFDQVTRQFSGFGQVGNPAQRQDRLASQALVCGKAGISV